MEDGAGNLVRKQGIMVTVSIIPACQEIGGTGAYVRGNEEMKERPRTAETAANPSASLLFIFLFHFPLSYSFFLEMTSPCSSSSSS